MKKLRRPSHKLLSLQDAEELLAPYFDEINESLLTGITEYQKLPAGIRAKFRARTAANVLNDLVIEDAIRRFDGQEPGVCINQDYEGALFIFGGEAAIRFKKTNDQLRPKNIKTDRQVSMECQMEIEGVVPCTLLNIAYIVDEAFTRIVMSHLVCWNGGNRPRWSMTISEMVEPFLFPIPHKQQKQKTAKVRSKVRQSKSGG